MSDHPRILFLGSGYAGHRTRFVSLRSHLAGRDEFDARWALISGWRPDGRLERLPLPRSVAGRVRATAEAAALLSTPRPDVIWSSGGTDLAPFAPFLLGPLRRPLVLDLDWTVEQREALAPEYFARAPRTGLARRGALLRERLVWDRVTLFTPWSEWAASSLRRQGVVDGRIRVMPPGVDLDRWRPPPAGREAPGERPLRLLFVGGDFRRKGGDLLVSLVAGPLQGQYELDVVTRDPVEPAPGVRVHRAEPGSELLRRLYGQADLFALPSRAECFGLATLEAMASGLPVIVSNVGASPEIVDHGRSGWLVAPEPEDLLARLRSVAEQPWELPAAGQTARQVAERRFDGRANAVALAELLLGLTRP